MNIIPTIIIILIIIMALLFYPWFVSVAFILTIALIPSLILSMSGIFQMLFLDKPVDFKEIFVIGGIFSLAGIPIYLILIMPVYSILLKVTQFPIVVTFPSAVTIIMLLLFAFFTTKSWGYIQILIITGCSVLHSLVVLWLISKLKSLSL